MQIAEAARRSGLSIDTIRYYERSALLPAIDRGADGRRRFSAEVVEWLVLLHSLRETGMAMKTMRAFAALYRAGADTVEDRARILLEHAEILRAKKAALERCEALLARKLARYQALVQPAPADNPEGDGE